MRGHNFHRCNRPDCFVCTGGLSLCTTCGGGEAELSTDCPWRKTTDAEREAIKMGRLDFVGGKWVKPSAAPDCMELEEITTINPSSWGEKVIPLSPPPRDPTGANFFRWFEWAFRRQHDAQILRFPSAIDDDAESSADT